MTPGHPQRRGNGQDSRTPPRYWAVLASAGGSARMGLGKPKQYLNLRGRALLEWSLAPFLDTEGIDGVVVVLARGDTEFAKLPIARHPKIITVTGGVARADSVLAGLAAVTAASQRLTGAIYTLIHDAARPCLTVDDIERLRDEATDDNGGLLALPVTDTLKRNALESSRTRSPPMDDEAAAMEAAGYKPLLLRGRESNLKVTYPEDLPLAEFWLSRQEYAR